MRTPVYKSERVLNEVADSGSALIFRRCDLTVRPDPDVLRLAWAGHSVEMLMRVYARCVVGIEDVWITRMDATPRPAQQERSRKRGAR